LFRFRSTDLQKSISSTLLQIRSRLRLIPSIQDSRDRSVTPYRGGGLCLGDDCPWSPGVSPRLGSLAAPRTPGAFLGWPNCLGLTCPARAPPSLAHCIASDLACDARPQTNSMLERPDSCP
jgi:hypothetical protein